MNEWILIMTLSALGTQYVGVDVEMGPLAFPNLGACTKAGNDWSEQTGSRIYKAEYICVPRS